MTVKRGTIDLLVRFSAYSSKIGPINKKKTPLPFYFLLPPTSGISLDLIVSQKSFTYQNLQDFITHSVATPHLCQANMTFLLVFLPIRLKKQGAGLFLFWQRCGTVTECDKENKQNGPKFRFWKHYFLNHNQKIEPNNF